MSISNIPELVLVPIHIESKSMLLMLLMTISTMHEMSKFHLWLEHPVYCKLIENNEHKSFR